MSRPVVAEHDDEGALAGQVIFFSEGSVLSPAVKKRLQRMSRIARLGRSPNTSPANRQALFLEAVALGDAIWREMQSSALSGAPCPAFAKANVLLLRSGECRICLDESDLFTTEEIKTLQWKASSPAKLDTSNAAFSNAAAAVARQSFFFIRDLAHRHYHHHRNSDLLTTTFPWMPQDDETWRRETQYGLARLAIAARRRDTAEAYKHALGLVAYAEAFQKHLCGWFARPDGGLERSVWGFAYDFAALRQSIDASLKVRELRDSQRRQTLVFIFGFVVTMLGLVVTGLRTTYPPTAGSQAVVFKSWIDQATSHPFVALISAGIVAWAFDLAVVGFSARPRLWEPWVAGLSRFAEALMGTLTRLARSAWLSYVLTLLVVGLLILAFAVASGLAYWWAYRAIAEGGSLP